MYLSFLVKSYKSFNCILFDYKNSCLNVQLNARAARMGPNHDFLVNFGFNCIVGKMHQVKMCLSNINSDLLYVFRRVRKKVLDYLVVRMTCGKFNPSSQNFSFAESQFETKNERGQFV